MSNTIANTFIAKGIPVLQRGEEGYERSVATPNLLFRFARPDFVLQPETPKHVQDIVTHAKAKGLKLTIKCGGHSGAGHSTALDGVSVDLRKMNKAKLDDIKAPTIVTFGGGSQWGHVYKTLINERLDGFVINGGRCPSVGVGGFVLGGGLGPFSRSIGMGSDNLLEATIVTADGALVTVKDTDDKDSPEGRLFWALRGGGAGNFGIVVEMKMAVKKLHDPDVVAGRYQWFGNPSAPEGDLFDQQDFMPTMVKFYTTDWPDCMTIDSTWICDLRLNSGNGVRFITYFDGNKETFDATIKQHVTNETLATQLIRRSLCEKSTRFLHETLVAQWSEETTKAFPTNRTYSLYSSFAFKNEEAVIKNVTALIREKMIAFRGAFPGERVAFLVTFLHAGNKTGAIKSSDSAIFWRDANYYVYLTAEWEDKWMEKDMREFFGNTKQALRFLSLGDGKAAYINFPDGTFSSRFHESAYFGDNREELRRVKAIWDKDNFFQSAQGVRLPLKPGEKEEELDVPDFDELSLTDMLASKQWQDFVDNVLAICNLPDHLDKPEHVGL
ncbi:hypothetical protein BKA62DRAFT_828902 [Auriculariales sp. MPI-PUGE-AT-0066]|nr:hypothetical protein BKA62DRAFT_828902 [Auriculariales sp. MPI-PUGE-AT-0066]